MATLPLNIDFKEWASQIRIDLPNVTIPIPPDVEYWKPWAAQVVNSNFLFNVPLPTSDSFLEEDGWKIWAAYFINSI